LRTESWFISCGLLGLTQNGLVFVIMPLAAPHSGAAGLTYAAFSLLGVFAPFLGSWADRAGRHRDLLVWGTISSAALLLLFDFATEPLRVVLAAGAGLGAMATTTAGNVLAIQGQPEPLWDPRVAALQRYISAGQVVGISIAGLLARNRPGAGFIVADLALMAAGPLAFVSAPVGAPRRPAAKPTAPDGRRRHRCLWAAPPRSPPVLVGISGRSPRDRLAAAPFPDRLVGRLSGDERLCRTA
jgi:MFS family permease